TELFNETRFDEALEQDLQDLSQCIQNTQPVNDDLAVEMINRLDEVLRTTTVATNPMTSTDDDDDNNDDQASLSYNLTENDIPMIYYGHLDRKTITREFQFNLQVTPSQSKNKFHAR
ncbi:unnamed protein product, partial [Adineta ricciae]